MKPLRLFTAFHANLDFSALPEADRALVLRRCYWPLLRPGGILMGDDFNWRAVSHDAQLFARAHGLNLTSFDGCHENLRSGAKSSTCVWFIQKPLSARVKGGADRRPPLRQWRWDGSGGGRWDERWSNGRHVGTDL